MSRNTRVLITFGFGALLAFAGLIMRLNAVSLAIMLNSHLPQPIGGFARPLAETANVFLLAGFFGGRTRITRMDYNARPFRSST